MKRFIFSFLMMLAAVSLLKGQTTEDMVSKCTQSAGPDTQYLKDFRVQLGSSIDAGELRFKAQMSMMKNIRYRFSLCNTDDSKGKLVFNLVDDTKKLVLTSFDQKAGKAYSSVDFLCSKTGIYEILFDFTNRQQGSGVGVVSLIK